MATTKITRVCEKCSAAFLCYPSQVRDGGGRFCSRVCCDLTRRKPKPPKPIRLPVTEKVCTQCATLKPIDQFRADKKPTRNPSAACIKCLNAKCRAWHRKLHPLQIAQDLPDETWKSIAGYDGIYSVSNMGRIRRDAPAKRTYAGRLVKPIMRLGYYRVMLYKNGAQQKFTLNVLVAEAFLKREPHHEEVNHKSGDKTDNRAENLEWVTHAENMAHARHVLGVMGGAGRKRGHGLRINLTCTS